jgi:hypothetical protein
MKIWTTGIVAGLLAGAVILGSLPALAVPHRPYLDRRELRPEHRFHPARFHRAEARMRAARMNHWERARFHRMANHNRDIHPYRQSYYRPVSWVPRWH